MKKAADFRKIVLCAALLGVLIGCGKQEHEEMLESEIKDNQEITVSETKDTRETISQNTIASENAELSQEENSRESKEPDGVLEETNNQKTETVTNSYFAAPSTSGKLHVEGTLLVDENGNGVQLKGISTHGISWFPDYVNQELFHEFRNDWGMNVVRLAMYTAEGAGYCTGGNQEELKKLVTNGVEYATQEDLYVIIDWHILSDGNPVTYQSEATAFFTEMAKKYAEYDNVLYEICNEPNGGTDWSTIKGYAEHIIGTIRTYDQDAVIIVGTPTWSQEVDKPAADPITDYDNIMYTLHFYADTHRDGLRETAKAALQAGLPLFVSEFGICDASGNGAINESESQKWIDLLDSYGVSYVMWNLSNKAETSSVISAGCSKKSGFVDADLSASGKWLYQVLSGKSNLVGKNPESGNDDKKTTDSENQNAASPNGADQNAGNAAPKNGNAGASGANNASGTVTTGISGSFSYTLTVENSWGDGSSIFYQYGLTIQNNGAGVDSWSIEIPFDGSISLEQGWCADFSVSGTTLTVRNVDWNGSMEKGSECSGIGFILKK